jgi:two-component sensor histidine kinase
MPLSDSRIHDIMELLMSYARLDFDQQITIDENDDELSAITAGVNMLGEELKANSVSLREKERLLKELHHRVKNNMQIIVSMLRLQTVNETDPKILAFVRDSKNRIESMALVHEMLYSSEGFEFTQLQEYVDFLQRSIFLSYAPPKHEINVKLDISEECFFKIDRMIPLGLIINEMITNTLKHAFVDNKGLINIKARKLKGGKHILQYSDNGLGLPDDFDIEQTESLGMQLILMLTEQLDGVVTFSSIGKNDGEDYGLGIEVQF